MRALRYLAVAAIPTAVVFTVSGVTLLLVTIANAV